MSDHNFVYFITVHGLTAQRFHAGCLGFSSQKRLSAQVGRMVFVKRLPQTYPAFVAFSASRGREQLLYFYSSFDLPVTVSLISVTVTLLSELSFPLFSRLSATPVNRAAA